MCSAFRSFNLGKGEMRGVYLSLSLQHRCLLHQIHIRTKQEMKENKRNKHPVPPAMLSTRSKAGRTSLSSWSCILPPNKGPMSGEAEHQMSRGSQRQCRSLHLHLHYYTRCLMLLFGSLDVAQPRLLWQEGKKSQIGWMPEGSSAQV